MPVFMTGRAALDRPLYFRSPVDPARFPCRYKPVAHENNPPLLDASAGLPVPPPPGNLLSLAASLSACWRHSFGRDKFQRMTKPRKMPRPWAVVETPGGFRVDDADGKALAYCYGLEPSKLPAAGEARLSLDEARRIAAKNREASGPPPFRLS